MIARWSVINITNCWITGRRFFNTFISITTYLITFWTLSCCICCIWCSISIWNSSISCWISSCIGIILLLFYTFIFFYFIAIWTSLYTLISCFDYKFIFFTRHRISTLFNLLYLFPYIIFTWLYTQFFINSRCILIIIKLNTLLFIWTYLVTFFLLFIIIIYIITFR